MSYTRRNQGVIGEAREADGKWVAMVISPDRVVADLGEYPDSLHAIAAVDNAVAALTTRRDDRRVG